MSKFKITILSVSGIFFLVIVFNYIVNNTYSLAGNRIIPVNIKGNIFKVEVVSSDQKMQKGLGDRRGLCEKCGMLFYFQRAGKYSFWMKDMRIPLDIIWISEDKIVHIEKDVKPDFPEILSPVELSDKVLEINAGNVDKLGIQTGDSVDF